jgi:hypothetical protein
MRIACWNLNNRVGKVRFRPEAALAAGELDADLLVLTEYHPRGQGPAFQSTLESAGFPHQVLSSQSPERANQLLMASKLPLQPSDLPLPTFDNQLPANLVAVTVPAIGLSVLGVRIPAYQSKERHLLKCSWHWLEAAARSWISRPSIIIGDLNVRVTSPATKAGDSFRRIMAAGWQRAEPTGAGSFISHQGSTSEIDHALLSPGCALRSAAYVTRTDHHVLAGAPGALSDHAALLVEVRVSSGTLREAV